MGSLFYIIRQDAIYNSSHKDWHGDNRTLARFFHILNDISTQDLTVARTGLRPESHTHPDSTFDVLKQGLRLHWEQTEDTVYPYGDWRQCRYDAVWTFDVDNDFLLCNKKSYSGRLALSLLRQRLVTFDDFEPCEDPKPPIFQVLSSFPPPYWQPTLNIPERNMAFTGRVLKDFNDRWRHILRNKYNDITFRRLASGVLEIASLSFKVVDISYKPQLPVRRGAYVNIIEIPKWKAFSTTFLRIGRAWVTIAQDPADCIQMIREHLAAWQTEASKHHGAMEDSSDSIYLIFSIRHIILCRASGNGLEWTQPEAFLDGMNSFSNRALEMLLHAISSYPPPNAIQHLSLELQDRILSHLSQGPVEPARVGCVLGLGSPFKWIDGRMRIDTETVDRNRSPSTPVESQILFGGCMSGISYKGNVRTLPEYVPIPTWLISSSMQRPLERPAPTHPPLFGGCVYH